MNTHLNNQAITEFRSKMQGKVLLPNEAGYDQARAIWNGMIDRKPAIIAQCTSVTDVIQSVSFAKAQGLLVSIKGGGHNIAGNAVCDDGLMIDLSGMKSVNIDSVSRRANIGPGVLLNDFDHAAQVFGLATPLGLNSTTGVAGLTLGGGFGWMTRKYGMTVDNLVSADVVTAEGHFLHASADENADLFWALRGGGGNFGIVTNFEFNLYPIGPNVLSGLVVYPFDQAKKVLKAYTEYAKIASEDLFFTPVLRHAPPLPFLPESMHGKLCVIFAFCHLGDEATARREVEPIRQFDTPVGEAFGMQPYEVWQTAFDPLLTPGVRNYWKSHNMATLSDAAIDIFIDYSYKMPSQQNEIFIPYLGGFANRVPVSETAYAHRDTQYVVNIHTRWDDKYQDKECITWARSIFNALTPHAIGSVYVNFMPEDETDRVVSAFGVNHARLTDIKRKYDPSNFFRINQNIKP